jgi:hypothetical protein
MPPPRFGWKPYSPVPVSSQLFAPDDPLGWMVHEFHEMLELQPRLYYIANRLMTRHKRLLDSNPESGLPMQDVHLQRIFTSFIDEPLK